MIILKFCEVSVMALGKKFDVTLEFEEVMSIETVGDIFRVLNEKGIK